MIAERITRRYACPDDCGLHCVIESTTVEEHTIWECPGGRGRLYDWLLLDGRDDGLRGERL